MAKFKTTHVGSLPRPQEMITKALRKQTITENDVEHYLKEIIGKQLSLGINFVNNGELPRNDYVSSTVDRISGFDGTGIAPIPKDMEELPDFSRRFGGRNGLITLNPKAPVKLPACSETLSYTGEVSVREELNMMVKIYNELKPLYPDLDSNLFFTTPSPGTVALFMENKFYPSYESYLESIAAVLKQEYDIINNSGFLLQVDCPDLAMGRHTGFKHLTDKEFVTLMETNVQFLNQALSDVDPNKCRVHICWGNYAGTHHCDIDFKKIYPQIMKINAKYISIEASNHRHSHEWSVFEEFQFPEDKVLMPGVIDTSSNIVEHPDLVAQRIQKYANLIGTEHIIASTDCGFATTASAASVTGEIAWLKLGALVEGAKRAENLF
ncbi:MAG: cobalamin-independent methionine synthase II family protein [Deltaproteobacteria bacterium]|jgi:5-methyltetrahydropteroyltriglutamate--homocysteine methyltransferase|nr:cobalamin-independent methionine synthase II family protein [Deltaproteobacteria bacterium]